MAYSYKSKRNQGIPASIKLFITFQEGKILDVNYEDQKIKLTASRILISKVLEDENSFLDIPISIAI